jgi:hypothetical protein
MLEAIFSDVMAIFRATFLSGDLIGLGIAAAAILVASLAMSRGTQVGSMTLLALTLFALGGFARGFLKSGSAEAPGGAVSRVSSQLEASWAQFANMQAGTLLAYFIAFMALILVIFGLKSALNRG